MSQEEYKNKLEEDRAGDKNKEDRDEKSPKKPASKLKQLRKQVSAVISLPKYMEIRDVIFAFAVMMSLLKDIIDIGLIGILLTPLTIIITMAAMLACGSGNFFGKKKLIALLSGGAMELMPVLGGLPAGTVSDILIYVFILKERSDAYEKQEEEQLRISSELNEEYA